jgi:cell division septum initiation protein DivIVA
VVEFKPTQGGLNVANDLKQLTSHIEQLRQRLAQTADTERSLVQGLSDALKRFDQEILQNVRTVAAEHEARRTGILNELHALAASIGTFLPAREASEMAVIEQHNEAPYALANGHERPSYHDELELNLRALLTEGSRTDRS